MGIPRRTDNPKRSTPSRLTTQPRSNIVARNVRESPASVPSNANVPRACSTPSRRISTRAWTSRCSTPRPPRRQDLAATRRVQAEHREPIQRHAGGGDDRHANDRRQQRKALRPGWRGRSRPHQAARVHPKHRSPPDSTALAQYDLERRRIGVTERDRRTEGKRRSDARAAAGRGPLASPRVQLKDRCRMPEPWGWWRTNWKSGRRRHSHARRAVHPARSPRIDPGCCLRSVARVTPSRRGRPDWAVRARRGRLIRASTTSSSMRLKPFGEGGCGWWVGGGHSWLASGGDGNRGRGMFLGAGWGGVKEGCGRGRPRHPRGRPRTPWATGSGFARSRPISALVLSPPGMESAPSE